MRTADGPTTNSTDEKGDSVTRERHDPETVIQAIRQHHGLLAPAAKMLGYDRTALYNYVARHKLQWVIDECREAFLDWTENELFAQIKQGNVTAMIFALKCLGKSRGYVERVPLAIPQTADEAAGAETDDEVIVIRSPTGTNGHHA
jgi:hypothetical protein